jgi:diguanylate cyclase (GGDEF)-like protein
MAALRKDGTELPIELSLSSVQRKDRWSALGIIRDITGRKLAEEELRRTNEKLSALVQKLEVRGVQERVLSEMRMFLQACSSTKEIAPVIAHSMQRLFPNSDGALFLLSPSKTDLETAVRWGDFPEQPDENVFSPDACWGLRRGGVYVVDDVKRGLICPHMRHLPATAYACLPLMAKSDVLGLLHLRTRLAPQRAEALEMTAAVRDMASMLCELLSLSISNLRLSETLSIQSIRDPLTGLFNRRYMEETLQREIYRAARKQNQVGVVMADIDHFKTFNDLHGHAAGDLVLMELAGLLKARMREADIPCRYGGEEFTLVFTESSLEDTIMRANELKEEVKDLKLRYGGQEIGPIALSMGVSAYPANGTKSEELLRSADAALYRAKQAGRDKVVSAGTP